MPASTYRRTTLLTLGAALAMSLASPVFASLPPSIDGQPMPSLAPMLAKVTPAVVNISTKTRISTRNAYFDDPLFRQLFGNQGVPRERVEQSLGSGVVIDAAKGYVLTNNHVVGGADDITVTLQDGRDFKAKLLGTDPDTDVAVLQIPAENLQALPIADSAQLRVGDFVVAVGDPFGLGQTATSGMVSALGRSGLGKGFQNFIQTDASINPGNSGGALVNLRGELVGINSMIYTPSGGNVGIGFAIPTDLATGVMKQLLTYGKVRRGNLGRGSAGHHAAHRPGVEAEGYEWRRRHAHQRGLAGRWRRVADGRCADGRGWEAGACGAGCAQCGGLAAAWGESEAHGEARRGVTGCGGDDRRGDDRHAGWGEGGCASGWRHAERSHAGSEGAGALWGVVEWCETRVGGGWSGAAGWGYRHCGLAAAGAWGEELSDDGVVGWEAVVAYGGAWGCCLLRGAVRAVSLRCREDYVAEVLWHLSPLKRLPQSRPAQAWSPPTLRSSPCAAIPVQLSLWEPLQRRCLNPLP